MRQYTFDPQKLAEALGIPPEEWDVLLEGDKDPFWCRCSTCLQWWVLTGPDEDGLYGPFTAEEIQEATRESGLQVTEGTKPAPGTKVATNDVT